MHYKDIYEAKYKFLINQRENVDLRNFNDSKAFIEYSNEMCDIYKNIKEYNPNKKHKFMRGRELNICNAFIARPCFAVPEYTRLNCKHCFIMKIQNTV